MAYILISTACHELPFPGVMHFTTAVRLAGHMKIGVGSPQR